MLADEFMGGGNVDKNEEDVLILRLRAVDSAFCLCNMALLCSSG